MRDEATEMLSLQRSAPGPSLQLQGCHSEHPDGHPELDEPLLHRAAAAHQRQLITSTDSLLEVFVSHEGDDLPLPLPYLHALTACFDFGRMFFATT